MGNGLPAVRVVAFSGRETDVPHGIWGEIAAQLGKFDQLKDYYAPLQPPGRGTWINLLGGEPTLILLDELPPYLDNAKSVAIGNSDLSKVTATALTNLFEAVAEPELGNVCVVITDLVGTYAEASAQIAGVLNQLQNEALEVRARVEAEVRRQLDSMKALDDTRDPSFADTDYQLAAYAAALRVLTASRIEEIDVAHELNRTRTRGEVSPVVRLIERAVKIACDHLVPRGIEPELWRSLSALERLYLKGLELESHGEKRAGVYQELARSFGVDEYKPLLANTRANETRLKTAGEFGRRELSDSGFGASPLRQALFATCLTAGSEGSTAEAIAWLKTEVPDYATRRRVILSHLEWLAALKHDCRYESLAARRRGRGAAGRRVA